jgi:hypothetical protein
MADASNRPRRDPHRDPDAEILEQAPRRGSVDRIVTAWRSVPRRTKRWTGGTVGAAAAVVLLVVAPWQAETPDSGGTSDAATRDEWKGTIGRGPAPLGAAPAETGTFVYRSCDPTCSVTLVTADGDARDLADSSPAFASELARAGLDGVSLSWDAAWWGVPTADGYAITSAGRATEFRLRAGPTGSRWELLGWSPVSSSAGLARWTGRRVTAYASNEGSQLRTYEMTEEDDLGLRPIDSNGMMATLARPVDPSLPAERRPRVTVLETYDLSITSAHEAEPGTLWGQVSLDLSSCLRPGETLIGPQGVPSRTAVPPDRVDWDRGDQFEFFATAVYAAVGGRPVPSAVILDDCVGAPDTDGSGRYDLPWSTSEVTWRFLGVGAGGTAAMTRTEAGADRKAVVLVGPESERRVLHCCLPADAQVLMPGMTLP